MQNKYIKNLLYLLIALSVGVGASYATSKLTPPGSVSNTMYSLTDIWNLHTGTTTTEGTGAIETTPTTIAETGKTLTEVYTDIAAEVAKLSTTNIASGTTAFGITGKTSVVDTENSNATTTDIISPKTAYVNGVKITGIATAGYTYPSKPLQTFGTSNYCTDVSGNIISCTGTGQDGEYQAGQARSYTDNGDLTITDNATGLMWQKCTVGLSGASCGTGTATSMIFSTAITTCEALTLASHTDWRLPNVFELYSLVTIETNNPAINIVYFPNTRNNLYWSSSIFANSTNAWITTFETGVPSGTSKVQPNYVRCVRTLP